MAPAKKSQASLTRRVSSVSKRNPGKPEVSRPLSEDKPVTAGKWLEFNKHMFLTAKFALRPAPDSTERELKAWKDFQNWLRFHKPPFDARDSGPWLTDHSTIKTPGNVVQSV